MMATAVKSATKNSQITSIVWSWMWVSLCALYCDAIIKVIHMTTFLQIDVSACDQNCAIGLANYLMNNKWVFKDIYQHWWAPCDHHNDNHHHVILSGPHCRRNIQPVGDLFSRICWNDPWSISKRHWRTKGKCKYCVDNSNYEAPLNVTLFLYIYTLEWFHIIHFSIIISRITCILLMHDITDEVCLIFLILFYLFCRVMRQHLTTCLQVQSSRVMSSKFVQRWRPTM